MNTDDLNERCEDKYCTICGPPVAADHANPFFPPVFQVPTTPVYKVPPWEDDE